MYRRTQRSASIDSRSPVVVTVVTTNGDRHVVVAGGMSIVGSDPAALAVVIDWSGFVVPPEEPFATFSLDVLPAFDAGRAHALRRRALDAESSHPGLWDEIRISFTDGGRLIDELCWYGPDVCVLEPEDVRAGVVARLRSAARQDS